MALPLEMLWQSVSERLLQGTTSLRVCICCNKLIQGNPSNQSWWSADIKSQAQWEDFSVFSLPEESHEESAVPCHAEGLNVTLCLSSHTQGPWEPWYGFRELSLVAQQTFGGLLQH